MARYFQILEIDDVTVLAQNANVPKNVVESVKQHLFANEYRIAVGPNRWRTRPFIQGDYNADLWEAAARGERIDEFRNLIGHEYLEQTLMNHMDVPYVSSHPDAWIDPLDWSSMPTSKHFGAHDLSPNPVDGGMSERQLERWRAFLEN